MRVAAIQMVSGPEVDFNLKSAAMLVAEAAAAGAKLVALPENFAVLESGDLLQWGQREAEAGVFSEFLQQLAREHQIWLLGGTVPTRRRPDGAWVAAGKVRPASILWGPDGQPLARYDKLHLFDVMVDDAQKQYQESARFEAGTTLESVSLGADTTLGLSVCYDLRFAELYGALARRGCHIVTVPSAFTYQTGQAHWEVLLRARAIENQLFIIAPGQGGQHSANRRTWGHSMIVDPWGRKLAEHVSGPGLAIADLDFGAQQRVNQRMPIHAHRRFMEASLFTKMEPPEKPK